MTEPAPGSVVLTDGERGTAWQRHASDRLWHSTTGRVLTWEALQQRRRLIIIHVCDEVVTPQRKARHARPE